MCATVLPVRTVSETAVATIIGHLDCWDRQEVIIKCNQQQNMVRRAELLQGRRRPRRTNVECILEGRRQSNAVVENAHHHLVGLLQTMRSDLKDNTGESVDVKPLLASWLARCCAWKLARLAIGDDGLTTSRRQRCKDCTRSFRRMLADQQWNPETQRMFVGVLWSPSEIVLVSIGRIRKRDITRVLVKTHEVIQRCAVGKGDAQAHVPKCRKRLEDIFVREKETGQPRDVLQQAVMGRADEEARPVEQRWGRDGDGAHVGACSVRGGQRGTGIWQENLEQYLARFTEARTSAIKAGRKPSWRCMQARKYVCGNTTTCSDACGLVSYYVSRSWMVY